MNDARLSLPEPAYISVPWDDTPTNISLIRNSVRGSASTSEAVCCAIVANEPRRERKRWTTSHFLHIDKKCKEDSQEKQHQSVLEEKLQSQNPVYTEDTGESRRLETLQSISESQCHDNSVSKTTILHEEYPQVEKPITLFQTDKNHVFDEQVQEIIPDSPVAGRIPSPSSASSVTSGKRLEWDSGADVGYNFPSESNLHPCASLSTIERIALARGCSAVLFERLDPEGICGPQKSVKGVNITSVELDSPLAKSTPVNKLDDKKCSEIAEKLSPTPDVEPVETVLPGGYLFIHSSEEFENDVAPSRNESEEEKENSPEIVFTTDNLNRLHSNSLMNLSSSHEEIPSSMPRSQSYVNLPRKNNHDLQWVEKEVCAEKQPYTLAAACSVSSSSVATIVQKPIFPKTSDKFIQTLPLKLSVGVQVSESIDNLHLSHKVAEISSHSYSSLGNETKNLKEITTNNCHGSQNHRCGGAHKKGSSIKPPCQSYISEKSNPVTNSKCSGLSSVNSQKRSKDDSHKEDINTVEKEASNLDSAASSSQTVESSCALETSGSGVRLPREGHNGSAGVLDSANSFEYLPGHVFEKEFNCLSDASGQTAVSEVTMSGMHSKSKTMFAANGMADSNSSSLSKDIEEGVELLQKLMCEKSYNGKVRKKLIRQIVNKLVNTNYSEDDIDKEERKNLSSNVPWVPAAPSALHLQNAEACHYLSGEENKRKSGKSATNSSTHSSNEENKGRSVEDVATSDIHTSPSIYPTSGSLSVPGDYEQSPAETSEISSNNNSENSKRNWKFPTSRTEKDFETNRKKTAGKQSLIHLCKSEHEKQLQWIRFEIDHLSQLKQLLEKQEVATKTVSNLVDHEHKFHKIKPADRKRVHGTFQRPKTKGYDNWPSSIECSSLKDKEYIQENSTLKTDSSLGFSCPEPLLSESYHCSRISDSQTQFQELESKTRITGKKHNFSTQTPTLDSFILHNTNNVNSKRKGSFQSPSSESNDGCLNVYVQTSSSALKRNEKMHQSVPTYAKASVSARESYKNAMKCCCDCRRALEKLQLNGYSKSKDEQVQTFCRCKYANSGNKYVAADETFSSFNHTDSTAQSSIPENSSNSGDRIYFPQKQTSARETVVNKSIQTTPSLNEVPLISHVRNPENSKKVNTSKNESDAEKDKVCPCCGHCEMPFESHEQQINLDKHKNKGGSGTVHSGSGRTKNNEICDVSVQTTNKEPLAYLLTFEPTNEENVRTRTNDTLPEIKLLVPIGQSNLENELTKKTTNKSGNSKCKENQHPSKNTLPPENRYIQSDQKMLEEKEIEKQKLTLQEYLRVNRPDYIQHADKRSQCLADLALLRDLRKEKRLELMAMTQQVEDAKASNVPTDERIVFSCATVPSRPKYPSRVMREQSRRKYHKTREVQNKLVEKKKKEDFRTNRLMAELFTKKLQKKVLEGVVNHSNSASVISSIP